jgi:nicotinamide phosphoribosyltransferase
MTRDGTLVIRPDSGHPVTVITKVLDILDKRFGSTINDKGYRVLDPHVRIIQGDGVDATSIGEILREMKANKWSADNIAFGMCGALLQKLDRDTQRFAFKCSAIENDICWQDVYKSPITDTGKLSKRGRLKLLKVDAKSYTTGRYDVPTAQPDVLQDVFLNGKLLIDQTFDEIRERSNQ